MKIGINGYEGVIPRFGYDLNGLPNRVGSSEVAFEWLIELNKIDKQNEYVIFLPVEPTSDLPREREGWRYEILPNKPLWTIFALSPAIRKQEFDVFFSPTHYGPLFAPCPQVISILDISYKHFPKLFKKKDLLQLNLWGGYSVRSARKIITISRSSKDDIIKEYHVPAARVHVAYLCIKEGNKSKMSKKKNIKKKYKKKIFFFFFAAHINLKKIFDVVGDFFPPFSPPGGKRGPKMLRL